VMATGAVDVLSIGVSSWAAAWVPLSLFAVCGPRPKVPRGV
jgi:hypothetical protein